MNLNYVVKQNFKSKKVYYLIGESFSSSDLELLSMLLSAGLLEPSLVGGDVVGKDESLSSPPEAEGLDSDMGEDLGGYEDDGTPVAKPKKSKKKKG